MSMGPTNMSTMSVGLGDRPSPKGMGFPSIEVNRTKNNNTQIFGQNTDKAATTRNNEGSGFFMTAVDSTQDIFKQKRASRNIGHTSSPSLPVSSMSMYTSFDDRYGATKSKLLKQQERAKQILLRKYCDAKERASMASSLESKQLKAEKTLKKVMKEKMEVIKEHADKSNAKIREQEKKRRRLGLDLFEQGKEYDYEISKKVAHWKANDEEIKRKIKVKIERAKSHREHILENIKERAEEEDAALAEKLERMEGHFRQATENYRTIISDRAGRLASLNTTLDNKINYYNEKKRDNELRRVEQAKKKEEITKRRLRGTLIQM